MRVPVSTELLERYRTSAPRYTSYPTAVDWQKETFDPTRYPDHLRASAEASDAPLSLYVHLPFCAEMCLFCGCNVVITRKEERVARYLDHLRLEFERVLATGIGRRPVHQLHWGGGTPTHLSPQQLREVFGMIRSGFELTADAEVAIEVDPRVTTAEHLQALGELGFNRVSMGVQDFEPKVQEAVKRVQPLELTQELVEGARASGMGSVNLDLMYGLPHQSRKQYAATIEQTLALRPERVALFHYAHVPWMKKHQTALDMDAAPSSEEKLELFADAVEAFQDAGYVYLGLDHFALPGDELADALAAGTLHRNFMGYTTRAGSEMLSFGVSAIGEVDGCFVQNLHQEPEYVQALADGGLGTFRGHRMSDEDRLRRDVILGLMCNGRLDKAALGQQHGIDFDAHFAAELQQLRPLAEDGLVEDAAEALRLTPLGQMFMRNVAVVFDTYYAARQSAGRSGEGTFSKTL